MPTVKLFPIVGMNNVADDDALQQGGDAPKLFVKDAVNVDFTDSGKVQLRRGSTLVTTSNFKNLWQSPLHHDVFATLERQIVKVDPVTWGYEVLLSDIDTSIVCYEVVNNLVLISTANDVYSFNGSMLSPFTIDTPASPLAVANVEGGTLGAGDYIVAISYLRNGVESGLSENIQVSIQLDQTALTGSISLTLPLCLDASISHVAVYMTTRNGGELRKFGTFRISTTQVLIDQCEKLGRAVQFTQLSPMPSGKFMKYWQGRLLVADKNIIRFSQALAYHLYDERHDFVMLPQRITFLVPVDSGIWVGQVDHVVFLSGTQPSELALIKKTAHAPIPLSAIEVDADTVGSDISQGGGKTALWLAENGYVLGTSAGQVVELHAGVLKGISAKAARSVRLGRRLISLVS